MKDNSMNPAAKHIITWHLERCEIAENEIEILMGALTRGYDLRQFDAIDLAEQYITTARALAVGLEDQNVIELMYRLHQHYEALDQDERIVDALAEVRAILESKTNNPFSDRIAKAKISAIETGLARARSG